MKTFTMDTHAWMAYFDADKRFQAWIENNRLETPASVVAEIATATQRRGYTQAQQEAAFQVVFDKSIIVPLEFENAKKVGELVAREKLHFADALVYAFATKEKPVLTGDPHFKGKANVQFIE